MKNKIIPFVSFILATAFLFSCSSDDDNDGNNDGGINAEVSTSKQYKSLEAATDRINDLTSNTINPGIKSFGKFGQKMNDCFTVSQELNEDQTSGTATIDFGSGCEIEGGDTISGKILMSFSFDINGENISVTSNQTMENLVFNDMTINGTTKLVISITGQRSEINTNSKIDFGWADGLTATIEETSKNEFFMNNETSEFYSLLTNTGTAKFNNGDLFSFMTTTPLRTEDDCEYPVSGIMVNKENNVAKTLDFGNGECDSMATVTDAEGNTTTIDLETTDEDFIF